MELWVGRGATGSVTMTLHYFDLPTETFAQLDILFKDEPLRIIHGYS
jgi:hypothetical protein